MYLICKWDQVYFETRERTFIMQNGTLLFQDCLYSFVFRFIVHLFWLIALFNSFLSFYKQTDVTPPTVTDCPSDIVLQGSTGSPCQVISWREPVAVDESGGFVSVQRSNSPGECFMFGSTLVRYTFTDAAGNQARCTFSVQINFPGMKTIQHKYVDFDFILRFLWIRHVCSVYSPSTSLEITNRLTTYFKQRHNGAWQLNCTSLSCNWCCFILYAKYVYVQCRPLCSIPSWRGDEVLWTSSSQFARNITLGDHNTCHGNCIRDIHVQ